MQTRYVSYAGIGLGLSTPELETHLNQLLPIQDFIDWDAWNFQGYDTNKLPTPTLPVAPQIKLGTLYWPSDATRPAWFHAVVDDTKLELIRAAIPDPMVPQPLVMQDGRTGKIITAQMYFLPPRPINQLGLSTDGWLITLTDARFYWHWKIGLVSETPASWTDLFSQLGTMIGTTVTPDTIPSEYSTPSSKWVGGLRPPATVLDSAASQIGQRVFVQLDGTVASNQWSTAKASHDVQVEGYRLAAGGLLSAQDIGRYVPWVVAVAFSDWSGSPTTPLTSPKVFPEHLGLLGIEEYGDASGMQATGLTYADLGYNSAVNASDCEALSAVIATDWYGWRLADDDLCIPGIEPYEPTGWEDSIEWVAQMTPGGPTIQTRIRRGPFSQFASGTAAGDNPDPSPPPTNLTSDCSALISLIQDGSCFTLSLSSGLGSCDCVEAQSSNMTWNAANSVFVSDDYFYGCAPGVVTTLCIEGAPRKFRIDVAGFTGASVGFNGTYTVTWSSGETWTVILAGVTATFVQTSAGDWTVTLDDGSNAPTWTVTGIETCCEDITLALADGDGTTDPPATLTAEVVTACGLGPAYMAYLDLCETDCDGDQPRLRMIPAGGSGVAEILFSRIGCDGSTGSFSTSNPLFCTGDLEECGNNSVIATVTCDNCVVPCDDCEICVAWTGPGFYCTEDGCVEYLTDPGNTVRLCSGPSTTVEDCEAVCDSGVSMFDCGGVGTPEYLRVRVTIAEDNTCPNCIANFPSGGVEVVTHSTSGSWVVQAQGPAGCDPFGVPCIWQFSFLLGCDGAGGVVGTPNGGGLACSPSSADTGNIYFPGSITTVNTTIVDGPDYGPFYVKYKLDIPIGVCGYFSFYIEVFAATCATNNPAPGTSTSGGGTAGASYWFCPQDGDCYECDPYGGTFNCIDGGICRDPGDGSGRFKGPNAEAECNEACSGTPTTRCCNIQVGDICNLVWNGIVYNGVWNLVSGYLVAAFPAIDATAYCSTLEDNYVQLQGSGTPGGLSNAKTTDCGPPTAVYTFDKDDFTPPLSADPVLTTTL